MSLEELARRVGWMRSRASLEHPDACHKTAEEATLSFQDFIEPLEYWEPLQEIDEMAVLEKIDPANRMK